MTADDVTRIFDLFSSEYERFEATTEKAVVWATMLSDIPFDIAKVAAITLIAKIPYVTGPKLSDMISQIVQITTPKSEKITGADAWGETQKAIRYYGRYKETELLESLSPVTREVVIRFGLKDLIEADLEKIGVTKGQFLKMFEQYTTQVRQDKLIPVSLQKTINKLTDKYGSTISLKAGDEVEE